VAKGGTEWRPALEQSRLLVYPASLSLGRLLTDHLGRRHPDAENRTAVVCDSADALRELVLKGLGVAWLPWSLVAADCRSGLLNRLGSRSDEVVFEVRLYRPRARMAPHLEALWEATAG
jgi:DNA-binding transcriptional LysR family regulator